MFPQPNSVCSLPGAQEARHHPNIFHGFITHKPRPASYLPWLLPRHLHTGMGSWGPPVTLLLSREAQGRNSTGAPTLPLLCSRLLPLSPGTPCCEGPPAPKKTLPKQSESQDCVKGQIPPVWVGPQGRGPGKGLPGTGLQS